MCLNPQLFLSVQAIGIVAFQGRCLKRRSRCALQVCHVAAAQGRIDLPLFTGFVSHEQLEAVIGNTAYERWAASRKELLHWVKMRGPGKKSCQLALRNAQPKRHGDVVHPVDFPLPSVIL